MESSRRIALRALVRWRNEREFADQIINQLLGKTSLSVANRGFTLELFYGVLRNLTLLDFWIEQLRSSTLDPTSRDLLRLGLYQLFFLKTPPHAAVFETVAIAPPRARKLINAILRRAQREQASLTTAAEAASVPIRFSTPEFLAEKWTRQFSAEATLELCHWNSRPAPIYARINQLRTTAAEFLRRYPGSFLVPGKTNFVGLTNATEVAEEGDGYIQDPSTAIACEVLQPRPGESVLDACAAPGGKTAYLAEMMSNTGSLVAVDADAGRIRRLSENLSRLRVTNTRAVQCNWLDQASIDVAQFRERSFDRILVDAPCTNTGVMRRRVDVRWRLRRTDFERMPRLQFAILRAVAPLLKPGGSLVYSTCSLEPEENRNVVASFLQACPDFRLTNQAESLPFRDHFDGAFAAGLHQSAPVE
jgi:16S rRNA (cytosine967-C5)-methyltransferase